jgi:hypothetical protein
MSNQQSFLVTALHIAADVWQQDARKTRLEIPFADHIDGPARLAAQFERYAKEARELAERMTGTKWPQWPLWVQRLLLRLS